MLATRLFSSCVKFTVFAQEVVLRFENQGETQHHLEQLKEDNEEEIKKLTDQKMKLQGDYEQMKYSGEAKLSRSVAFVHEDQDFWVMPFSSQCLIQSNFIWSVLL